MITPLLEKLILEGKAEYQNYNTGLSQLSVIQVPKNCHVVITSIHFYAPNITVNVDTGNLAFYALVFQSENARYDFVFRKNITEAIIEGVGITGDWLNIGNGEKLECYQVHSSDIKIRCIGSPDSPWVSQDYSAAAQISKEPGAPQGFLGLNILKSAEVVTGSFIEPQTLEYNGIAILGGYAKQLTPGIVVAENVFPAPTGDLDYPLMNVGYVLIKYPMSTRTA